MTNSENDCQMLIRAHAACLQRRATKIQAVATVLRLWILLYFIVWVYFKHSLPSPQAMLALALIALVARGLKQCLKAVRLEYLEWSNELTFNYLINVWRCKVSK